MSAGLNLKSEAILDHILAIWRKKHTEISQNKPRNGKNLDRLKKCANA